MDYKKYTAPCGIDCFNCPVFEDNLTAEMQLDIAEKRGMKPEQVTCKGCRVSGCFLLPNGCEAKSCIERKGVEFCFECDEFPCPMLQPALDGAELYPQNYKLFNLCRIKNVGVEKWAKEESMEIRRRYYQGKIVVGAGPKLE